MERKPKWLIGLVSGAAAPTLLRVVLFVVAATAAAAGLLPVAALGPLLGVPVETVPSVS